VELAPGERKDGIVVAVKEEAVIPPSDVIEETRIVPPKMLADVAVKEDVAVIVDAVTEVGLIVPPEMVGFVRAPPSPGPVCPWSRSVPPPG
jgi:hypothetical protein